MPKPPRRYNPQNRDSRTVRTAGPQSAGLGAAALLHRIGQKSGFTLRPTAPVSWEDRLQQALPEELRPHLIRVLEKPGELVVFTESAVWAGRLKLALADWQAGAGATVVSALKFTLRVMPAGGFRK
jgi:hypothetical protein